MYINFYLESWKGRAHLEKLNIDGMVILKLSLRK